MPEGAGEEDDGLTHEVADVVREPQHGFIDDAFQILVGPEERVELQTVGDPRQRAAAGVIFAPDLGLEGLRGGVVDVPCGTHGGRLAGAELDQGLVVHRRRDVARCGRLDTPVFRDRHRPVVPAEGAHQAACLALAAALVFVEVVIRHASLLSMGRVDRRTVIGS
jgi:hypothetical protein